MKILSLIIIGIFLSIVTIEAQVSIIANKGISESSITVTEAGNIFSLNISKWSNNTKITVFDNASDIKNVFYKGINKDLLSLKKEWMKKQLTGEAKAPESLGSDDDVINKVSSTPGAIGFVKSSSVNSNVKVLIELK